MGVPRQRRLPTPAPPSKRAPMARSSVGGLPIFAHLARAPPPSRVDWPLPASALCGSGAIAEKKAALSSRSPDTYIRGSPPLPLLETTTVNVFWVMCVCFPPGISPPDEKNAVEIQGLRDPHHAAWSCQPQSKQNVSSALGQDGTG